MGHFSVESLPDARVSSQRKSTVYCCRICREAARARRYYQNHADKMAAIARIRRAKRA